MEALFKAARTSGMSTPDLHGMQYLQAVQSALAFAPMAFRRSSYINLSSSLREFGVPVSAILIFSSTCSILFIPERTLDTPVSFHAKRSAHSAGLLLTGDSSNTIIISWGSF